jgi:hypothetical protein
MELLEERSRPSASPSTRPGLEVRPIPSPPLERVLTERSSVESCKSLGLAKEIGVSNMNGSILIDLCRSAKTKPAVLQIEHHPFVPFPPPPYPGINSHLQLPHPTQNGRAVPHSRHAHHRLLLLRPSVLPRALARRRTRDSFPPQVRRHLQDRCEARKDLCTGPASMGHSAWDRRYSQE